MGFRAHGHHHQPTRINEKEGGGGVEGGGGGRRGEEGGIAQNKRLFPPLCYLKQGRVSL